MGGMARGMAVKQSDVHTVAFRSLEQEVEETTRQR